jgi:hypothetical protein
MSKRTVLAALLGALVLLCSVVESATAESNPVGAFQNLPSPIDLIRPSARPAMAVCSLKNTGSTAMAYNSNIESDDAYASYINPINCDGTNDYPMAVYWVSFPLYSYGGAKWPVGVDVEFWSSTGDSCGGPQQLLYSYHVSCDSSKFAAPHIGVVTLPSPVCVEGPFFVSVRYDGTTPTPYPSVLFDTQVPGNPCNNWAYRKNWNPWDQFFLPPGAGNFMVWIDGYSNSGFCATEDTVLRTIEGLHAAWPALQATRVTVAGYYTDSADGKLVSNYDAFLTNTPMPAKSELMLVGSRPDSSFQGDLVRASGYLMAVRDPHATSPTDTMTLRLLPYNWVTLLDNVVYPQAANRTGSNRSVEVAPQSGCDSCSYAIYLTGGVNEANEHARYWKEFQEANGVDSYDHGVCGNEAYLLYGDGTPPGAVPAQIRVDSLTAANVHATFNEVSLRVANCTRKYGRSSVRVLISGEGSASGLLMLGGQSMSPASFRADVQKLIDSGATDVDVDITQSYGGILCDTLKNLNAKGRTLLNIHSAAGNNLSYSAVDDAPFSRSLFDSADVWYDYATAGAALNYRAFLNSLLLAWQSRLVAANSWLTANPTGSVSDTLRLKLIADSVALHTRRADLLSWYATVAGSPHIWTRRQFDSFGYASSFGAPPGGQLALNFTGLITTTGGVTVYKDSSLATDIPKRKIAVWDWNIPGSAGYTSGNEHRVLNAESNRRTHFFVANDSRVFEVTADMYTDQPLVASTSNAYDFPGFSISFTDHSATEFGNIISPTYAYNGCELPGMRLDSVPSQWGSSDIIFGYNVPSLTSWHSDMELRVVVNSVLTPGTLSFVVSGMTDSVGSFTIAAPGTFKFDCHAALGTGAQRVEFLSTGALFEIDNFALHSKALDPVSCCVGTTGNVNSTGIIDLGDLSSLISYLTGGGYVPPCLDAANVNGLGIVDSGDLAALVSYLTGGGYVLPACP